MLGASKCGIGPGPSTNVHHNRTGRHLCRIQHLEKSTNYSRKLCRRQQEVALTWQDYYNNNRRCNVIRCCEPKIKNKSISIHTDTTHSIVEYKDFRIQKRIYNCYSNIIINRLWTCKRWGFLISRLLTNNTQNMLRLSTVSVCFPRERERQSRSQQCTVQHFSDQLISD